MNEQPTLLIVDDNQDICYLLKSIGTSLGFKSHHVNTASGFREFLKKDAPMVVALDLMLPDNDGIEMIKLLDPKTEVKLIIISGLHESIRKTAAWIAEDHGINVMAIIAKPFSVYQVRNILMKILQETVRPLNELS